MPWQCKSCKVDVLDNERCSGCNGSKNAWTIIADKTRTMVLTRKKFTLLKGDGRLTLPAAQAGDAEVTLSKAEMIRVLAKSAVKATHGDGHVPATADVIFVGLQHVAHKDHDVLLNIIYEGQPSEELEFPQAPPSDPPSVVYRKFLFVYGAEPDLADVSFEDLEIVDLTEDDGCASEVTFEALKRKEQELPAEIVRGGLVVEWDPPAAQPGEEVKLIACIETDEADVWKGAEVAFTIFHANGEEAFAKDDAFEGDHPLTQPEPATVDGKLVATITWTLPEIDPVETASAAFEEKHGAAAGGSDEPAEEDVIPMPRFAFTYRAEATVKGLTGKSDLAVLAPRFYFSL